VNKEGEGVICSGPEAMNRAAIDFVTTLKLSKTNPPKILNLEQYTKLPSLISKSHQ
jgi:hypothetical protein